MSQNAFHDTQVQAVGLLLAGVVGVLIAVLALTRSLLCEHVPAPGRRALTHWLPVAAVALVAAGMDQVPLAMGIIFGTSVVCLSAVMGFIVLAGPVSQLPLSAQRVWPFLPVPVLLAFVVGIGGTIGVPEAGLLVLQGLLSWLIWSAPVTSRVAGTFDTAAEALADPLGDSPRLSVWVICEVMAGVAVAGVAGWAISRGVGNLQMVEGRSGASALAAVAISAALVMPMVITGTPLAAGGQSWAPLSGQVGLVLLNMGLLLPASILLPRAMKWVKYKIWAGATTRPVWDAVPYPRISWQIDAVALLIAALIFVPVSQGKVRLDRRLGIWLIVGYCAYLLGILNFAVKP